MSFISPLCSLIKLNAHTKSKSTLEWVETTTLYPRYNNSNTFRITLLIALGLQFKNPFDFSH